MAALLSQHYGFCSFNPKYRAAMQVYQGFIDKICCFLLI
jgi:hypothetical protein